MYTKWLIGLFMAFTVLTIVSNIIQSAYYPEAAQITIFTVINNWGIAFSKGFFTGIGQVITSLGDLMNAMWTTFMFDYAFFYGGWEIFKYVVCWPISAGLAVTLAMDISKTLTAAFKI